MIDITKNLIPSFLDRSYCSELQFYHPENCIFNKINKDWTIIAERTAANGKPQFFSGILLSINKGKGIVFSGSKGEITLKARFDNLRGAFPAAWLLPYQNKDGRIYEIDIFEWISQESKYIQMCHHWGTNYKEGHKIGKRKAKGSWHDYHIYQLKWNKCFMWWKIDGKFRKIIFNRYRNQRFYLLINLAIGGWAEDPLLSQNRFTMNVKNVQASQFILLQ